jgi:hypothetical protein
MRSVDRSPNAAKMLASRTRRKVQGASPSPDPDLTRLREVVDAFLAASREGDFEALLSRCSTRRSCFEPTVWPWMRAHRGRCAAAVAGTFSGRARVARPALVNGAAGAVWAPGGQPRVIFDFTITGGKIVEIDILADPERLRQLELVVLEH